MTLQGMPLVGTLPAAWAGNDSFPALVDLEIGASYQNYDLDIFGSLPAEWGHASAFQQLELLDLFGCNLSGNETACSYSLKQNLHVRRVANQFKQLFCISMPQHGADVPNMRQHTC